MGRRRWTRPTTTSRGNTEAWGPVRRPLPSEMESAAGLTSGLLCARRRAGREPAFDSYGNGSLVGLRAHAERGAIEDASVKGVPDIARSPGSTRAARRPRTTPPPASSARFPGPVLSSVDFPDHTGSHPPPWRSPWFNPSKTKSRARLTWCSRAVNRAFSTRRERAVEAASLRPALNRQPQDHSTRRK